MVENNLLIIKQNVSTAECKAVVHACLMNDIKYVTIGYDDLEKELPKLNHHLCIPVGSVEYIRKVFDILNIKEPEWNCYPLCLEWLFNRNIREGFVKDVKDGDFVKPIKTKLWTGFVYNSLIDKSLLNDHDREQYDLFEKADKNEKVYISSPVKFIAEYRYYVVEGRIIGNARYDDNEHDVLDPSNDILDKCIKSLVEEYGNNITCSVDTGVLDNGNIALVELNDAWALGLYGRSMKSVDYINMLITRWKQIVNI